QGVRGPGRAPARQWGTGGSRGGCSGGSGRTTCTGCVCSPAGPARSIPGTPGRRPRGTAPGRRTTPAHVPGPLLPRLLSSQQEREHPQGLSDGVEEEQPADPHVKQGQDPGELRVALESIRQPLPRRPQQGAVGGAERQANAVIEAPDQEVPAGPVPETT